MKTTLKQQMNAIRWAREYAVSPKHDKALNDAYSTIAAMNLLVQHPESIQAGIAKTINKHTYDESNEKLAANIVKYLCDRGLPFGKVN